jgi:hypothetical protein
LATVQPWQRLQTSSPQPVSAILKAQGHQTCWNWQPKQGVSTCNLHLCPHNSFGATAHRTPSAETSYTPYHFLHSAVAIQTRPLNAISKASIKPCFTSTLPTLQIPQLLSPMVVKSLVPMTALTNSLYTHLISSSTISLTN